MHDRMPLRLVDADLQVGPLDVATGLEKEALVAEAQFHRGGDQEDPAARSTAVPFAGEGRKPHGGQLVGDAEDACGTV
ncbi:hypothetical protein IMZ11_16770 [Microtetraspora sp. AC03309]|uniref:hypothetical protein n=1 Tax=Microtetraspora sp. AC03309 TaxID=2779376 RepID=UPI001E5D3B56|nr:hypothetical protein [Microtetraspora sp. AC03309]MCC5577278.1 hypothetical protein [Microtetraspora sp. AC03309]